MRLCVLAFLVAGLITTASAEITISSELQKSKELMAKIRSLPTEFVAVQLWSPYCAPCGAEVSELNDAQNKLKLVNEKKLSILGVPMETRKRENSAFIKHFQPQFEQWEPDANFLEKTKKNLSLPRTVLFKGEVVVKEWAGKIFSSELMGEIQSENKFKSKKP